MPVSPALAVFPVPMAGLATRIPLPGGVEVALAAGLVAILHRLRAYWAVVAVDGACAASLFLGGTLDAARRDPSVAGERRRHEEQVTPGADDREE